MRLLYSSVLYLLLPLVLGYFAWRGRREPAYRARWAERFGRAPEGPVDVWLHAASLGETQAALPLIERLLQDGLRVAVTSFTPAGSQRVQQALAGRVLHAYLPLDLPHAVTRFLDRLQPSLGIVVETELWPNLYAGCAARGIPLLLASARLSEKSLHRYRRFPGSRVLRATLDAVTAVSAQTAEDAQRFVAAGADAARVTVAGNLKFDYPLPEGLAERGRALREGWGASRPVWIAASTHAGEEALMLEAQAQLLQRHPELLLVLVPRHPQRFAEVAALCRDSGLLTARRSLNEPCTPATRVLLLDTLGELNLFYAAADVVFVGGSLVPVGGHNLLEPAALGLPILSGPHTHSQQQIVDTLRAAGALCEVTDRYSLVERLAERLDSETLRRQAGQAGLHAIRQNQGALARVLARVRAQLPAQTA